MNITGVYASLKLIKHLGIRKYFFFSILQTLIGVLDIVGIALIGVVVSNSFNYSESFVKILNSVSFFWEVDRNNYQFAILIVASISCMVLGLRTFLSIFFTRFTFMKISIDTRKLSTILVKKTFESRPEFLQRYSVHALAHFLTAGVERATIGIVGPLIALIADIGLLLMISISLLFVNFWLAIQTTVFFSIIGFLAQTDSTGRSSRASEKLSDLTVEGNRQIINFLGNYREIFVRGSFKSFISKLEINRSDSASAYASVSFIPYIGKYLLELSVIIGALALTGMQFFLNNVNDAVATLAIFLTASTRIAPVVLRVQQGILQITAASSFSTKTFDYISDLLSSEPRPYFDHVVSPAESFSPEVKVLDLGFKFINGEGFELKKLNFEIRKGELTAIVGPSGSGKSTLIDLLLGIQTPTSGKIFISDLRPDIAVHAFPGSIAYVPQDVKIVEGTLRSNVINGFNSEQFTDAHILRCLEVAQLNTLVNTFPLGLETKIGEGGFNLSGGQKQRLGIARALYTKPKIIFLDEATSSLDAEVEAEISDAIQSLRGTVTIVVVAHRLVTIRNADNIIYLEDGQIAGQGKFDSVRAKVANFNTQALLSGL